MNERDLKTLIDIVEPPPTIQPTKYRERQMLYDERNNRLGLYVKGRWRYIEMRDSPPSGSLPALVDISDDTNLAVSSPIVLTDDTLSLNQGAVDHGSIGGLGDDDHTQYILHSLADAANDFLVASGANTFVKKTLAETGAILEGDLDHGNIQGLGDDDHTQYALLAGRSSGQTLIGGTGTTDDLILRTTAGVGASGADIIFQVGNNGATEAMRILNNGNVEIPTTTAAGVGVVTQNGSIFIHSFGTSSLYVGSGAGNLTNTGSGNIGIGANALKDIAGGGDNIAIGDGALLVNTSGSDNVAIGGDALAANVTASNNTAFGRNTLKANLTGDSNLAIAVNALTANTTGNSNTAIGVNALLSNVDGTRNTAIGVNSLRLNVSGDNNVAIGVDALEATTSGSNMAIGAFALTANLTGVSNVGLGANALFVNTTGHNNVAVGASALAANVSSRHSTAVGTAALVASTGASNTALGRQALRNVVAGANNIGVGYRVGENLTSGSTNILIGFEIDAPSGTGSNQLNIGNLLFSESVGNTATLATGGLGIGVHVPLAKLHAVDEDAVTNTVVDVLRLDKNSSGTPAAGYGLGILLAGESTTTAAREMSRLTSEWATATDATRKALSKWTVYDTAEREAIRIEASGTAALIGLYGATAVAQAAGMTVQLTSITHTAPGVADYALQDLVAEGGAGNWGFATQDEGNTLLSVVLNLQVRVAELEAMLDATTGIGVAA